MSTARRGGDNRRRPQKHQNEFAWSFSKNKTDPTTKIIQSVKVDDCCRRCTDVINWKITYGKYKPLSRPAKCVKCEERKIKQAYHVLCSDCAQGLCAKCGGEIICSEDEVVEEETES